MSHKYILISLTIQVQCTTIKCESIHSWFFIQNGIQSYLANNQSGSKRSASSLSDWIINLSRSKRVKNWMYPGIPWSLNNMFGYKVSTTIHISWKLTIFNSQSRPKKDLISMIKLISGWSSSYPFLWFDVTNYRKINSGCWNAQSTHITLSKCFIFHYFW